MKLNQTFRHHKGGIYTLLHIAQSESDGSEQAKAAQSEWISVEDRLPQLREDVLVAWSNGEIGFARRFNPQNSGERWDTTASYATITHWQPLPEPPKAA